MTISIFKKFIIKFRDQSQKQEYEKLHTDIHRPLLNINYFFQCITALTLIPSSEPTNIPSIVIFVVFLLAILNNKLKNKNIDILLSFNIGLYFIWNMYQRSIKSDDASFATTYIRGLNGGINQALLVICLINGYQMIVVELCLIGAKVWLLRESEKDPIYFHIVNDLCCILVKLVFDWHRKKYFVEIKEQKRSLEHFKSLFQDFLPSNVVILNEKLDSILLANKAVYSILKIENSNSKKLFEEVSRIKLDYDEGIKSTQMLDSLPSSLLAFIKTLTLSKNYPIKTLCTHRNIPIEPETEVVVRFEATIFSYEWLGTPAVGIVLTNISHTYELMNLKTSNDLKEMAISTVAHELRNPLAGLFGSIQMIENEKHSPIIKRSLDFMKMNIQYVIHLLNSILDIQQLKANRIKIVSSKINISDLLYSVNLLFEFQCITKNLNFQIEIDKSMPVYVESDRDRLLQILINLCANAIKFTFKGSITVKARKIQNQIEFSVKDTGVGMRDIDKEKLFQAFGKLDATADINQKGVGLGLLISNSLVKLLNNNQDSQIKVNSVLNEGSEFYFTIPLKEIEKNLEDPSVLEENIHSNTLDLTLRKYSKDIGTAIKFNSNDNQTNGRKLKKESILIADDNPFSLFALQNIVKGLGYDALVAHNGEIAIEVLQKIGIDEDYPCLIFMDCEMPVMDGREASIKLNDLMKSKLLPVIPIIGASGNIGEDVIRECLNAGMVGYIKKPISKETVLSIIRKFKTKKD